jgi:hypothetical protein
MPETWPGFDGLIRTRACIHDAHPDCAHLIATGGGARPGPADRGAGDRCGACAAQGPRRDRVTDHLAPAHPDQPDARGGAGPRRAAAVADARLVCVHGGGRRARGLRRGERAGHLRRALLGRRRGARAAGVRAGRLRGRAGGGPAAPSGRPVRADHGPARHSRVGCAGPSGVAGPAVARGRPILPPAAALDALRGITFFGGAASGWPLAVLAAWAALGVLLAVAGSVLARPARRQAGS